MNFGRGWRAQRERKLGKEGISADGEIKSGRKSKHLWNGRNGRFGGRCDLKLKNENISDKKSVRIPTLPKVQKENALDPRNKSAITLILKRKRSCKIQSFK
jgi:hypothetical protein